MAKKGDYKYASILDLIVDKIVINSNNCWDWTGPKTHDGYPLAKWRGIMRRAHRLSYYFFYGDLQDDLTIDHLCSNRSCINPKHLEQVDGKTNTLRGNGPSAINKRKTQCKSGHPFDEKNTYIRKTGRTCRICREISWKKANLVRKERNNSVHK